MKLKIKESYGDSKPIKFYYKGNLIFEGDKYDLWDVKDKFISICQRDNELTDSIIAYCNSFGDPLLSDSETDLREIVGTFFEVVIAEAEDYEYDDNELYVDGVKDVEIFTESKKTRKVSKRSMKESDMIKFGSRDEDLGSLEYALEKYVGKPVEKAKQYLRDLGFDMFVMAGPSKRDETWEEYTTDKDNSGSVSVKLYFDLDSDPKNPRRKLNGKLTDYFVDRYN